ncbi:MAG: sensor histidine kinase [Hyphomicrobiaceae bacterium]
MVGILEGMPVETLDDAAPPAGEDRYRKLIQHMPTALLQVDARAVGHIFTHLKTQGVTNIAAYFEVHPEVVELGKDIVRVAEVNNAAVSLFRARNAAQLIQSVRYLFAAAPGLADRVMTAHFEGKRSHTEQAKILTFDGEIRSVVFSVTYPTPPEQQDTTFITLLDITDRLNTEAQLRRLQADHTRAARISTLGELVTSIAHEVKQPLAAIVTNGEASLRWLSRGDLDVEKVRQLTGRIIASARRASDIIQRIRDMIQKREPERSALDLREVLEEALLCVQHELETKSISLTLNAAPVQPKIIGDRVELQQVFVNLLINSIQAIDLVEAGERQIRMSIEPDDTGAFTFSIRDSGPGIAGENLDRIFQGFFTTKNDGMGIGLVVCQSIISAHGGRIEASNHPDGGACFRFSIPAAASLPRT